MGNFMLRYLLRAIVLAAALFFWVHALILSGDMVKSARFVSFRYETDGIPCPTVNRMLEEEGIPFAAWLQVNGQSVKQQEFSRNTTVQVLEIAGDSELVLSPEELLYGFLPVRGNVDTCAIDATTAYTLWGGTDVTGEILIYGDKEYTIAGVFSRPENTMLIQSSLNKNDVFPYLELSVSGLNTVHRQEDEFRTRYLLPEPDILINHMEKTAILGQLALLPALLAASLLLWKVLRQIFGKPLSSLRRVCFTVSMLTGVLISAWVIGLSPVIPAAAIPGRWSDFSFWFALMKDMTEQARLSRALAWPVPDLLRRQGRYSVLFYSGGALAGFVISILWKPEKRGELSQYPEPRI